MPLPIVPTSAPDSRSLAPVTAGGTADQGSEQRAAGRAAHDPALLLRRRTVRHLFRERDRIDAGGLLRPRLAFRGVGSLLIRTLPFSGIDDRLLRGRAPCERCEGRGQSHVEQFVAWLKVR